MLFMHDFNDLILHEKHNERKFIPFLVLTEKGFGAAAL